MQGLFVNFLLWKSANGSTGHAGARSTSLMGPRRYREESPDKTAPEIQC